MLAGHIRSWRFTIDGVPHTVAYWPEPTRGGAAPSPPFDTVAFIDGFAEITVAGVPLPWLILGVGVYPVLVLLGWRYVRRAERTERAFARLVQPGRTTRGWPADAVQRGTQVEP